MVYTHSLLCPEATGHFMERVTDRSFERELEISARRVGLGVPSVRRLAADRMLVDAFLEAVEGGFVQLARAIAAHA
jgi:hypothetical protein